LVNPGIHIDSNERILKSPPAVLPVTDSIRPQWSVMIPVYNCAQYLPETIASVLVQDQGEKLMQIEVIDDASTDQDVEQLVARVGKGRVQYFRQPANVGSLRNFLTCLNRAKGRLVHLLHGDDRVRPRFYARMDNMFTAYPTIGAAFCRYDYINSSGQRLWAQGAEMDHEGILENWLERLCECQRIQYAAMVVKRDVYERLGGFYGAEYGEDWEMWVRIAAHYEVGYIPDILAEYRRHQSSISGKSFTSGKNMQELTWVMNTIAPFLPPAKRESVMKKSRTFYAHHALRVAKSLWIDQRNRQGATAQVHAAWNMQKDVSLFCKIMELYTRMTLNL
jgi:glycosyltransferase involved in cell wall biosynthesis